LVAFGAIFYFMLIRPQRKRQQQMNDLVGSLKRGDKIITAGGIHGDIDSVGDTSVVLVLEDGAKLRMAKTSIVRKRDK
jgi:preprotein translocase subunit YajC